MEIVQSRPIVNNTYAVRITCSPNHGAVSFTTTEDTYTYPDIFYHWAFETVTLTATVSGKPSLTPTEYEWDFGDGTRGFGNPVTKRILTRSKDHLVHVRVRTREGRTLQASLNLMLQEAPPVITENDGLTLGSWTDGLSTDGVGGYNANVTLPAGGPPGATKGYEVFTGSAHIVWLEHPISVVVGSKYRLDAWVYVSAIAMNSVKFLLRTPSTSLATTTTPLNQWIHLQATWTATSSPVTYQIWADIGSGGGSLYIWKPQMYLAP